MEIIKFACDNLRRKPKSAYFFAFSIIAASASGFVLYIPTQVF